LMLTQGYEADGWLGLLLGTSMWYGFYGQTLLGGSAFDDRMDALCREIGSRGRADADTVGTVREELRVQLSPDPTTDNHGGTDGDLRRELQSMRITALQRRAVAEGVDDEAMENALDQDDSRGALVALLLQNAALHGPAKQMLTALATGGEESAQMLTGLLEHAMDALEQLSSVSPRAARRPVRELSERVDRRIEALDAQWCDALSRCGRDELDCLSESLASVRGLSSSRASEEALAIIAAAVDCLERCAGG